MNIYLDNAGVVKNCRYIKAISRLIGEKERIDLYLRSDKRINLLAQMLTVICVPTIKTIRLTIHTSKLLPELIWFANHFNRYTLEFVVDKPLTKGVWKRICRLQNAIYIDDRTQCDHSALYRADRRVSFRNRSCDGLGTVNAYYAAVKMPLKQCQFSSCLGRTVYISKSGAVSFCMERPEQTYLGQIGELKQLFHTPQFLEALQTMIAKRGKCSRECSHYQGCAGGCVFWTDCDAFRKECDEAVRDVSHLIETRCDLSKLPVYKERSVIYRLFSRKNYADSVKEYTKEEK